MSLTVSGVLVAVGTRTGGGDAGSPPDRADQAASAGAAVRTTVVGLDDRLQPEARGEVSGSRTARLATPEYSMVAVTWRGAGAPAWARTHGEAGWGGWRELEPLEDLAESEGNGVRGSELLWVGPSDAVQVRIRGRTPHGLAAVLIDPGVLPTDSDAKAISPGEPAAQSTSAPRAGETRAGMSLSGATLSGATLSGATLSGATQAAADEGAPRPGLYPRQSWGANEDWRNSPPRYNDFIKQVHVHHTAGSNGYARDDVPAILRGIYRYHTHSLGWSDIGYNFLVDRFGRTWIGRYGGYWRPIRGAHTLGFNYNSVGVAVLGSFQTRDPSSVAVAAIVRLAAWKLDMYDWAPARRVYVRSEGSDLYPAGRWARLYTIDGHRDTNQTACPGERLYRLLPSIRKRAQYRYDIH